MRQHGNSGRAIATHGSATGGHAGSSPRSGSEHRRNKVVAYSLHPQGQDHRDIRIFPCQATHCNLCRRSESILKRDILPPLSFATRILMQWTLRSGNIPRCLMLVKEKPGLCQGRDLPPKEIYHTVPTTYQTSFTRQTRTLQR